MTNNNNSDYTKQHTDLFDNLPEVYQSDTNKSVFKNLFDRFLTKQETEKVAGYIGKGNPNAIVKRQIIEPTLHRQTFQLQPILYNKIGSIEHMASWKDISNELERLGVNIDNIDSWGELLQFNWIPPVDIDKIVHFNDYYWYDEDTPNSKPQYLTIRSRCSTATANANFWKNIVDEFGETIPIQKITPVDNAEDLPVYDIISIDVTTNTVIVSGDASTTLQSSNYFDITNTLFNDGIHIVLNNPIYDEVSDTTSIDIQPGTLTTNEVSVGNVSLRRFDKITLNGEFIRLFDPGFIFFVNNSTNTDLNSAFWETKKTTYDEIENTTTIKLTTYITDNTADGVISLTEQLNLYLSERDCQCSGSVGWDLLQWDDNPSDPLWGGVLPGDHANMITAISNTIAPVVPGVYGLWYDITNDKLYQWDNFNSTWILVWNKFSLVLQNTTGFALWDFTPGCGKNATVETANQWIEQNKWLHKSDVPNFSIAKQAQFPILEYDWDLELNEWTYTDYKWKYRRDRFSKWEETDVNPSLIELIPLSDWLKNSDPLIDEIVLDEKYGDLTSWFTKESKFQAIGVDDIFEVDYSTYASDGAGLPFNTRIRITVPISSSGLLDINDINGPTPLRPYRTSLNDPWKNYGDQWLFVGQQDTLPVPHQTFNDFATISETADVTVDLSGNFEYKTSYYAQSYTIISSSTVSKFDLSSDIKPGTNRSLRQRARIGTDSIRVYINNIRQYGTYDELDDDNSGFVSGIQMLPGFAPTKFDTIRIEVGEATYTDFGKYSVSVRMEEDNTVYQNNGGYDGGGNVDIGLIQYRKVEQVKNKTNQYPLFDIYNIDGTPAYQANAIFGYKTDPSEDVNVAVGLRTVYDKDNKIYEFDQFLIPEDNGKIYAYRDYSNLGKTLWINPINDKLKFWTGLNWDDNILVDNHYIPAVVSEQEPSDEYKQIDGVYWVDSVNFKVFQRDVGNNIWVEVTDIDILTSDSTLQTIWKKGLNDETYVPEKVDWDNRTLEEYTEQKDVFVKERAEEIILLDSSISESEAIAQATSEWNQSQANTHSPSGAWVGDWEIPDPLYYNNMNENRKYINSRELLTHFNSIIQAQPKIPGYNGPSEAMFHLIPTDEVNYGIGGKIKQYNNSFDTLLSSIFINNVTPTSLVTFAQDQYETLLNNLKEIYRKNSIELLTTTTLESLVDFSTYVANEVITKHELNDNTALIYGDTTTFTESSDGNDKGVRNWIATLPYLELIRKQIPARLIDYDIGVNQIVHHDGHRNDYFLTEATTENIIRTIIDAPDDRTRFPGPEDPPIDTFGRKSLTDLPPNNIVEFDAQFNTNINGREGVYWYYTPPNITNTLYRLTVASASDDEPSSQLPDGTTWMDLTVGSEVLRVKKTDPITGITDWVPADGLIIGDGRLHNGTDPNDLTTATVSAWTKLDLNILLGDIIFELENRLYDNAPDPTYLRYDFDNTKNNNLTDYNNYLYQAFLDYTIQHEIPTPLANTTYSASDPFTWNYKFSTTGAGIQILSASSSSNSFTVEGNVESSFSTVGTSFSIKNSTVNDGTWTTTNPSAIYDNINDVTLIYVNEPVTDSSEGVLYTGLLPSSRNDGSESGGDWRDYYQKLYGTPYPQLEPWKLQGYDGKPDWWDSEYLNDDKESWGDRKWKYKHGFDIIGIDINKEQFKVYGNFNDVFLSNSSFFIDRSVGIYDGLYTVDNKDAIDTATAGVSGTGTIEIAGNVTTEYPIGMRFNVVDAIGNKKGSYTVKSRGFSGPPNNRTVIITEENINDVTDFDFISGSTYDPSNNTTSIQVTDDLTVNVVEGRILVTHGMWENIRIGVIPPEKKYPNGVTSVTGIPSTDKNVYSLSPPDIPSYNYFSVNIDNHDVSADGGNTVYQPDDVFPPYWNFVGHFGGSIPIFDRSIRSVFFDYSTEIVSPGADYSFGDAGPVEWEWTQSSQWLYDQLSISFKLDPIKYVTNTFGIDFVDVAGLYIDSVQEKVLSHNRTNFHGEIIGSDPYFVNGTNQWYVNYNRWNGYDASFSDFRSMWTNWVAPLTYQFSSFIDTPSLNLAHRYVDISEFDYDIVSKKSFGVDDSWIDAFKVSVLHIPPKLSRYDNQLDWKFEINTNLPLSRNIEYYDVENYQFSADPITDTCTLYSWQIVDLDLFNSTFTIKGNQTYVFNAGRTFNIIDSTGNDGNYEVLTSVYNAVTDETIIDVDAVIHDNTRDGTIVADYRTIPWETGYGVYLSTTETLPVPLNGDTVNGLTKYFIIVESDNTFKLSRTLDDAKNGIYIDLNSFGNRDHFVGAVTGTFQALNGSQTDINWRHYNIDKRHLLSFDTPYNVQGIQTIVNIIDGYDTKTNEDGWRINNETSLYDPINNRLISWQLEVERFINYVYGLRVQKYQFSDRYEVSVDSATNVWTFTTDDRQFVTGDKVSVFSSNGVYPDPIARGISYYIIRDSLSDFRLAASKLDAENGVEIDITSNVGVSKLYIMSASSVSENAPVHEINPMREAIWYRPERGIVSNIITGPADDVRTTQLIYDQYGQPLGIDKLRIFREDKQTAVTIASEPVNQLDIINQTIYDNIHIGGLHLFVDAYEHVLKFNNYTSDDALVYDPFIGLNVTKFEMLFNRTLEFTGRPNIGGYYLTTFFNQGADLNRNIEANIEDLRMAYDTYTTLETNNLTDQSRKVLGYDGTKDYLDNLNLNAKSQFIFWQGQIQYKGSVNAMNAFINSRRFIDAKVDEFWAVKIADFGSAAEKEYPEMYVTTDDARSNDFRMQFVTDADFCNAGYAVNTYDSGNCGYSFPTEGDPVLITDESFTPIRLTDDARWYKQPNQMDILRDNGLNLYFDLKITNAINITIITLDDDINAVEDQYDGVIQLGYDDIIGWQGNSIFYRRSEDSTSWEINGEWDSLAGEPILRHNFVSDAVVITAYMYTEGKTFEYTNASGTTLLVDNYIPYSGGISVFKNGKLLTPNVNYVDTVDSSGNIYSNELIFRIPLLTTDTVKVVHGISNLTEALYHYNVNSNIVKLVDNALVDIVNTFPGINNMRIWGLTIDKAAQNPAKLIDKIAEVVMSNIQFWDPARDIHDANAIHNIDLQNANDPAYYTHTPQPQPAPKVGQPALTPWGNKQVGVTWLDTTDISYLPYYDTGVFEDIEYRLRNWGQLADWGNVRVWEWVKSDVPPEEYDSAAAADSGDISIPDDQRKSGNIRYELYENVGIDTNGDTIWKLLKTKAEEQDASIDGTKLIDDTYDFQLNDFIVGDIINIYVDGKLYAENYSVAGIVNVACNDYSRVQFVQPVPTDEDIISAGIEAGTLLRAYEYTTEKYYDEFGIELTNYYFWVTNKSVKSSNKNRTMSIKEAQDKLITGPTPYIVFQNRKTSDSVTVEGQKLIDRIELQSVIVGQQAFIVELPIAANTSMLIKIDGVPIPDSDISYTEGEKLITLSNPIVSDGLAEILYVGLYDEIVDIPHRYTQAIVRGLRGWIDDDRRYTIRFTRDFTLRDNLDDGTTPLELKSLHEEWEMFRQHQPYHVNRQLWDKITEAMVGYKLNDNNIRVPSYERELYDNKYGTDTRYGLRDGQAFTDGQMAIQTVLYDLQNPENNFQPVDINVFFERHNFDTNEAIIDSMNTIYNTFAFEHVNRIMFSVIHDAFSLKHQYPDLFKTSMVSLHGIRPFQIAGIFDD